VGLSIPSLVEKKLKKLKEKTNDEPCQHHVMINNDAQLIASIIKILILIKPAAPNFGNLRRQNKHTTQTAQHVKASIKCVLDRCSEIFFRDEALKDGTLHLCVRQTHKRQKKKKSPESNWLLAR
jgi:hypothetical protein